MYGLEWSVITIGRGRDRNGLCRQGGMYRRGCWYIRLLPALGRRKQMADFEYLE